jgi:hypothetical protein
VLALNNLPDISTVLNLPRNVVPLNPFDPPMYRIVIGLVKSCTSLWTFVHETLYRLIEKKAFLQCDISGLNKHCNASRTSIVVSSLSRTTLSERGRSGDRKGRCSAI